MDEYFEGDWITLTEPVYVLCDGENLASRPKDGDLDHRGLLWGRGNPNLAGLGDEPWAVVKVSSCYEIRKGHKTAVGFRDHDLVMEGTRRAALEALIHFGAQAEALTTALQVVDRGAVAQTPNWGTSIAGDFGIAKSGLVGRSEAGANGLAVTGDYGRAYAGEGGIAVVDAEDGYSIANAGHGGVAVGLGISSMLEITAGDGGIAICRHFSGLCEAGDHGIVVGGHVARAGANSIVIGEKVSGGPGSLLISRHRDFESGTLETATGVVGQNGIEPNVRYLAKNGVLERASGA